MTREQAFHTAFFHVYLTFWTDRDRARPRFVYAVFATVAHDPQRVGIATWALLNGSD